MCDAELRGGAAHGSPREEKIGAAARVLQSALVVESLICGKYKEGNTVMEKKRFMFISPTVSPPQVRFVSALREYYDADFYFLDDCDEFARRKPESAWKNELREHCHVIPGCRRVLGRWFTWHILDVLRATNPDILMLGGFSDWAVMIAYAWGRSHKCKIVIQTERSRNMATGKLRNYGLAWRFLHWYYRRVDMIMATAADIVPQFRDTFHFGDVVVAGRYPSIIDPYYQHPLRTERTSFTLLHANRLVDYYNPLASVRIFKKVLQRHPQTKMKMNASGPLRGEVEKLIAALGIASKVTFLDGIRNWDDLNKIYASCDIMILPATFSNGNYTVIECATSGMACFISDKVLGNPELLQQAQPGSVLPLDEDVFSEKICEVISHPSRFKELTERSRDVYRACTNAETAKFYHDLFKRLYQ